MTSRRTFLGAAAAALPCLVTGGLRAETFAVPTAGERGDELCLMTYNLRYASSTPPNDWPSRRPLVRTLLERYQPDLMGTQEGLYGQLKDMAADLPDHDWIGLGRDGGSRGEFMAIYYRKERFEPMEYDHFWLSDTPDVMGSTTWGNTNRRMVTWVRFRDRRLGRDLHFWNTHLDHALQPAREKAAALIRERVQKVSPEMPLFLVGDFNAAAKANPIHETLTTDSGLVDTWDLATVRHNEDANTFNGFRPLQRRGQRIDWILGRGEFSVRASEVVTLQPGGEWPSDHCPVVAWLTLK